MRPSGLRRGLALLMIVIVGPLLSIAPALSIENSTETAVFEGRVFRSDGVSPRSGVIVALVDESSGEVFRSQPTDDSGNFRLADAPAGNYAVVTEAGEGAFLAGDSVELAEGSNRPLSLTLTATPPTRSLAPAQASGGNKGMSKALKWGITGGIVLASLFLINELTEEGESTASDF